MGTSQLHARWLADIMTTPVDSFNMLVPGPKALLDAEECEVYADHCEQSGHVGLANGWRELARQKRSP